jgi:hypothetical protein
VLAAQATTHHRFVARPQTPRCTVAVAVAAVHHRVDQVVQVVVVPVRQLLRQPQAQPTQVVAAAASNTTAQVVLSTVRQAAQASFS